MEGGLDMWDALAAIPEHYAQPDPSTLAKLPKPYKKDSPKGKCDECGGFHGLPAMHLDYQGHADVTLSLIAIDPGWNWEPIALDANGLPMIIPQGYRLVMWARLTVLGKSVIGVGTCDSNKGDPEKELIGDFLRNAAMRFGIATRLWSKADSADPVGRGDVEASTSTRRQTTPKAASKPSTAPSGPVHPDAATDAQCKLLAIQCSKAGIEEANRITFVSNLVGRPIKSTHELTKAEISAAIEEMKGTAA